MRAMLAGRFPPLPDNGNRRSMVNVANVAEAAHAAGSRPLPSSTQTYIVTDAQDYSTAHLQSCIREVLGLAQPRWAVPLPLFQAAAWCGDRLGAVFGRRIGIDSSSLDKLLGSARYSSDKLQRELGFAPVHTLTEGLMAMYAEIRARP